MAALVNEASPLRRGGECSTGRAACAKRARMSPERVLELLEKVRSGAVRPEAALSALANLPFEDLGYARVDHHRALRQGLPEVIFGQGKSAEQIIGISQRLLAAGQNVLVT